MLFFIISIYVLAAFEESMLLVHSPKTPQGLRFHYNTSNSLHLSSISDTIDFSSLEFPSFILDISLDPNLFLILDSLSEYFEVPYLTLTKSQDFQYSAKRFSIFPPTWVEAYSLLAMIKYFEWKEFSILSSNFQENLKKIEILKNSFSEFQMKKIIYDKNISQENLDSLIRRLIKATGVRNLLVLDEGASLEKCINSLKLTKFGDFGSFLLFGLVNAVSNDIEGSVMLQYEVGKQAGSIEQFYIETIDFILGKFKDFSFKEFNKICNQNNCFQHFNVVNVKNLKTAEVGTATEVVNITAPIIFPGNNTDYKLGYFKKKLPIMIANGTTEPGNIKISKTSYTFNGAHYAAETANLDEELGNFEFVFIPTDCGNLYLDLNWYKTCLANYTKNLGLAYITGFWDESSLGNALTLKALKVFIPQVSTSSLSGFLNNKTVFPEFLKMTGNIYEYARNSLIMYRFYNWNDLMILTGDGDLDVQRYYLYTKSFEEMGVNVVNPEEYRFLPENYTRADFEKFRHVFEFIRDKKCRIIVVLITSPGFIYEALYDVGLRRGDLIIISPIKNFYTAEDEKNLNFRKKQLEIIDGSLTLGFLEYDTNNGKRIEKELKKRFFPVVNMCNTHDAFLTISNSVKYLIKKGEDYEDPYHLINAMRNQRFIGCSGDVFFVSGQNSRSTQWANYYQVIIDPITNNYDFIPFLALSKFSVLAARQINKAVWATGEESTPSNYRLSSYCVYSKHKQQSKYGLIQLHIVSIILFIVAIFTSFFSQKYFNGIIPELKSGSTPSYNDVLYQFFFVCEFFQILSLDPQNGIISQFTRKYNYFAGFNILEFFDFKNGDFWIFEVYLIAIILAYSLVSVFIFTFWQKLTVFHKYLDIFIQTVLPVIGHFLYMPVISMLFSIYKCEEGISDSLTESFLKRDCSVYCYRGKHLIFLIISSVSLVLFLIVSTFLRPFWEKVQTGLRIRTKAFYWSILSVFQLLFVLLKVNIEPYSRLASSYTICATIFCLVIITFKTKPFNYQKIVFYQNTLLIMDFWAVLFSSTFYYLEIENYAIAPLVSGLFLIYLLGTKISARSSEVFVTDDPNSIAKLIKFQFSSSLHSFIKPENKYKEDLSEMSMLELRINQSE